MRSFFLKVLVTIFLIGLTIGVTYFFKSGFDIIDKKQSDFSQKTLELKNPAIKKFSWKYKQTEYNLELTLYKSLYEFYKGSPKSFRYSGNLPDDWESRYYSMFLKRVANDESISEISKKLSTLAEESKLNSDQKVDFVLSFVQAIEYDDQKANIILAKDGNGFMNYPYEVLYEKKGVCSDKSFLLVAILKEMGYGSAFFTYKEEDHMAVGIKCPIEYSSYNSGYCYAETTSSGFKIGVVPDIDSNRKKAIEIREMDYFNQIEADQFNAKTLSKVDIFPQSEGLVYKGIIENIKIAKQIDGLKNEIINLRKDIVKIRYRIDDYNKKLTALKNEMDEAKKEKNYDDYNKMVPQYNDLVEKYSKETGLYNSKVNIYNQKIEKHNGLIKEFY